MALPGGSVVQDGGADEALGRRLLGLMVQARLRGGHLQLRLHLHLLGVHCGGLGGVKLLLLLVVMLMLLLLLLLLAYL